MREHKYDTLKGILILLVVFGHMLITYDYLPNNNYQIIANGIYIFHMPLFFIVSGYFSKNINKSNIIKYISLFLLMYGSFFLFDFLFYGEINPFEIKYSSWFILLLLIYRIIVSIKAINKIFLSKYILIFLFIISIISGYCFNDLFLVRLFSLFYFFILGYRKEFNINKKYLFALLPISIVLIGVILSSNMSFDFYMFSSYINNIEPLIRGLILIADTFLFISIINIFNNKEIPVITSLGKNCLYIYVIHRIPTLILGNYLYPCNYYILISLVISILLCLLINILSKYIKVLLDYRIIIPISIICLIIPYVKYDYHHELDINTQYNLDNSISIGFVGDLILLEDQLKLSNNNFDYMFDNMKEEFNNTNYVFGVLEGPVDDDSEFSYGNYSDDKELRLNYPTSFLKSIEDAGIDFVTISNNHMLDRGVNAHKNTIKNLNNSKLDYTGTKDNYKIINIEGLKVGVLAYTYGLNYLNNNDYLEYTNYLCEPYSKDFNRIKESVHNDFNKLKDSNVDLIIVMPHYGTEFSTKITTYQEVWNRIFINEGANIILGDHPHIIEPIQYKNNSVIINSPGNYINSYINHDGDLSMYIKIYIDKNTHKINGTSITPIIATKDSEGKYYPVLLENTTDKNKNRMLNMLGNVIYKDNIKDIKNTYYYLNNKSYKYENKYKLSLTNDDKESIVYKKISEYNNICFIGDSITEGTVNGYKPWYLPLMDMFNKNVINISKGSYTSYDIINDFSEKIQSSNCELTFINIGTNDIRYNKEDVNNYIKNINKIIELAGGEVIVLAPWETTERDYNIDKNDKEKRELYKVYDNELKKINNVYYINPNTYISNAINYNLEYNYIIDGVHPNNTTGIELYSYAVLRGSTD